MPGSERGFLVVIDNDEHSNIALATNLARSIKKSNQYGISLALPPGVEICGEVSTLFENIIELPWYDAGDTQRSLISEQWKLPYISPYLHTIKIDNGMLIDADISPWWEYLEALDLDVVFPTHSIDIRGNAVDHELSRIFRMNKLPIIRTQIGYFRKNTVSFEFFDLVKMISWNWQSFFDRFLQEQDRPSTPDADVIFALALKICDADNRHYRQRSLPTFVDVSPSDALPDGMESSFPIRRRSDV